MGMCRSPDGCLCQPCKPPTASLWTEETPGELPPIVEAPRGAKRNGVPRPFCLPLSVHPCKLTGRLQGTRPPPEGRLVQNSPASTKHLADDEQRLSAAVVIGITLNAARQ
jgi:hypothetical protein